MAEMSATVRHSWEANIGSDNSLVLLGNKPYLNQTWRHRASPDHYKPKGTEY